MLMSAPFMNKVFMDGAFSCQHSNLPLSLPV
jgi:hypothetical protein